MPGKIGPHPGEAEGIDIKRGLFGNILMPRLDLDIELESEILVVREEIKAPVIATVDGGGESAGQEKGKNEKKFKLFSHARRLSSRSP